MPAPLIHVYLFLIFRQHGGRKFTFSARKNEERKRAAKAKLIKPTQDLDAQPDMTVSLPLTAFTAGVVNSVQHLRSRLHMLKLPTPWVDVSPQHSTHPLTIFKVRNESSLPHSFTIEVAADFEWSLALHGRSLAIHSCEVLKATPKTLNSTSKVYHLLSILNSVRLCKGNADKKFKEVLEHRSKTLHDDG